MPGFKDPLDEEADAAGAASVEKHAERMAERVQTARDEDTETFSVEPPEPEEDDDEPEVAPTRRDRRASRQSARERAAAAEAKAEAYKEALALAGNRPLAEPTRQQGNPVAAIDAQIRKTFEDEEALNNEWVATSAKASPAEIQRMKDRAAELVVLRTSLVADRRDALQAPQRAEQARIEALKARAPDVYGNEKAFQYARGEYNKALARGVPDSLELHDACMDEARAVILGKRPAPDAAQRQRASGMGAGARQVGTGSGKATLDMPKGSALWRMAVAAYPDLEPAQACQKWAQTKGKRYQEAAKGRGR